MNRELTRTRQKGTEVTVPKNGEERIQAIKRIVDRKQYAKIDNCMIDLFSANAIVQVYDALGDDNKKKYINLPAPNMASIAFKLIK